MSDLPDARTCCFIQLNHGMESILEKGDSVHACALEY